MQKKKQSAVMAEKKKPMGTAERRAKSDAAKRARGEFRLTMWLSPEATTALQELTGVDATKGAIQHAVNTALIRLATRESYKGMEE